MNAYVPRREFDEALAIRAGRWTLTPRVVLAAQLAIALGCAYLVPVLGGCSAQLVAEGEGQPEETSGADAEHGDEGAGDNSRPDDGAGDIDCGSFLGCDDGGREDDCDFWMRDCPAGEKCAPIASTPGSSAWDNHVCVPAGDAAIGEPCTKVEGPPGTDSCDEQSMCIDIDPQTGIGSCVGFCLGSRQDPACPEASGSFAECVLLAEDYFNVCFPGCNPLMAGACPTGHSCIAKYEGQELSGFTCFPPAAEGVSGEACSCVNCCAAKHMCVAAEEYGPGCAFDLCCTEYCDVDDTSFSCQGVDQVCVPLFNPSTPEVGHVGRCVLP